MGWERRGNRLYLYKKVRQGDRVRSRYMCGGELFRQYHSVLKAHKEDERATQKEEERRKLEESKRIEESFKEVNDFIEEHLTAVLIANGYHKHKGQWRKQRGKG